MKDRVEVVSNRLVREYKDHSFVIDFEESRNLLGENFVKTDTDELELAERLYKLFDEFNYFLKFRENRVLWIGDADTEPIVMTQKKK
jgi:hypothetical protein